MAATISVGGACSLIDAITATNNDAPAGGCTTGNGSTITRDPGAPQFRILAVAANGNLTLQEITVSGGVSPASGGGGGVYNDGSLTLTQSTGSGSGAGYPGPYGGKHEHADRGQPTAPMAPPACRSSPPGSPSTNFSSTRIRIRLR